MYSRDMLGETQEAALETILGDIDEIDDIQRGFKPVHRTTMKDVRLRSKLKSVLIVQYLKILYNRN